MRPTMDKKTRAYIAELVAGGVTKIIGAHVAFVPRTWEANCLECELVMSTPVGGVSIDIYIDQNFAGAHCRVGRDNGVGVPMTSAQRVVCDAMDGNTHSGKCNYLQMPNRKVDKVEAEVIAAMLINHVRSLQRACNDAPARVAADAKRLRDATRAKLEHAVTQYDIKQSKRKCYNAYAMAQYLYAVDRVVVELETGKDLRTALLTTFNDRLLSSVLKACALPDFTVAEKQAVTRSPL